jgi:hypothetical protein
MAISVDAVQAVHVAQQQEVIVFGERFTQPARDDEWATLESVNDGGDYIEDVYTGGVKTVSATRLYDLVVRVLATDPWLRDVWPKAKAAQENGEKIRALFNDRNKDRPLTAQSDDVVIPKMVTWRLYNKVGVVELRFRGLFNIFNTVSGFPS